MIPAAFDYVRPGTLDEALGLLAQHGEDAKVLAGGHSLIPAMKLRLSQPKVVFEISGPRGSRTVAAKDFFVDMLTSAVESGEILKLIHVPVTAKTVAYVKFA